MSPLSQQTRSRSLTFIVVTAITLLIWIWAAGETRDSATLYARVGFTTPSNFNVIVAPTEDQQLAISVQGSARSIQRLRTALEEPVRLMTGSNGIPQDAGRHKVSLSEALQGLDSLLSIVQMPKGIPVSTFAIGDAGAANAGLSAISILALQDEVLASKLKDYREGLIKQVEAMDLPDKP